MSRIDWATLTLGGGPSTSPPTAWPTRAVELVDGRLVSDGYDLRAEGDPLAHAIFVFDVLAP